MFKFLFFHCFSSGPAGLASALRFGPNLVPPPPPAAAAAPPSTNNPTATAPTAGTTTPTADPNNYAGIFAQMLNMMSNQNLVSFSSTSLVFVNFIEKSHLEHSA